MTGSAPSVSSSASIASSGTSILPLSSVEPAGIESAVLDIGLEGGARPQFERVDRLHVEVPVDQHRRPTRRVQVIAVDDRMPSGWKDLDVVDAEPLQARRHPLARPHDVARMLRQAGDTGDPQKFRKLLEEAVLVVVEIGLPVAHSLTS